MLEKKQKDIEIKLKKYLERRSKMISIAMCTYNGEKYINEQIDSILNQTYKDFELVITDDGSTDNTIDIIKEYQKNDERIKLYKNEKNLGFIKNFEKAISLCSGDHIALADQDDSWKKNKLEVFINEIDENILIYSDAILMDEESNLVDNAKQLVRPENNLVSGSNNKAFLLTNCVSGNTIMFKRELIKHILPIPENISFHDIWIAFVATSISSITYTQESMTYYRRYPEQVTSTRVKNYKGFFDRLNKKTNIRVDRAKVIARDLNTMLSSGLFTKDEDKYLVKLLIEHYKNYENIFYNKKLHKYLNKYRDEVFAIYRTKKRTKRLIRTCIGLKLHKLTCFVA
ncbi:glycosyltransferase family 2 protein [Sulfurimonas lithotrophica]|uniref:Glycosyltransferase family 2 protein n=1 Tax=Sulfurimonas lithotrophica TaxID=2590022 RepID=A0A5P8NZ00_9BACT|nr:glycosyltransferase family 2 protein [Sulfurimonas lithotrophica]QFR48662.1 glycosyltransferase family 2 protein [Sulfurimonas lithotrophica]